MRKTIIVLTLVILLLGGCVVALWLSPIARSDESCQEKSYGVYEGLQLVERTDAHGNRSLVVCDSEGERCFTVPLRNCILDTRFRGGQLRFREEATGREGMIDRQGIVSFVAGTQPAVPHQDLEGQPSIQQSAPAPPVHSAPHRISLHQTDLRQMAQSNPFYREATKVLQGNLSEDDATHRTMILNYCEHFRTAYTTKDIDFLRQVFSDEALIIVGQVVKIKAASDGVVGDERVAFALHTKRDYLNRLQQVFRTNKSVDVHFSEFRIRRHPTMNGIYGVTLRQHYKSDQYADDGYLFLLWDFRDPALPLIHVRTWQPKASMDNDQEVIGIQDFNLQ